MGFRIVFLCGLFWVWLGGGASVQAQDLLKLFRGKGQALNIQTSVEATKARMKKQLEQLRIQQTKELKGQLSRNTLLKRKIQSYVKLIRLIQKKQRASKKKGDLDDVTNRYQTAIIDEVAHQVELLRKLQSVFVTRMQSMDDLVDALALSLRVHDSFLRWLTSQFPTSDKHKVLRESFNRSQDRLRDLKREELESKQRLVKLREQLQKNNKALRGARRYWLQVSEKIDDFDAQRHSKAPPQQSLVKELERELQNRRLRRRERRRLRKALRDARLAEKKRIVEAAKRARLKRKLQKQQSLRIQLARHRFEACQTHVRLLHARLEDEGFENRSINVYLRLYLFTQKKAGEALARLSEKAKGGLLYRSPPTFSGDWLVQASHRTAQLFQESPGRFVALGKQLYRNVWSQAEPGLYLLLVFCVFLFTLVALFGRRRLRLWLEQLKEHDDVESNTQSLWQILLLASRTLYDLLPYMAVLLAMSTALWAFQLPHGWNQTFFSLGLMVLVVRVVWILGDFLFADDSRVRFLSNLKDDFARRFRRVCKVFAGFAFFYIPFLQVLEQLGYSEPFLYHLRILFYGFLLVSLLVIFLSKEDVLQLIPTDIKIGRGLFIFLDRFYLLALLLMVGLFALYVAGYINLATYLARSSGQTILLLIAAYAIYQLIWTFGLWAFGFSRKEAGLVHVEKRWARNLLRLTRWLSGLILAFLVVFLSFEIWGVAYGFATIASLFTRPFFHIQNTQITLLSLLKFVCAMAASMWLSRFLKSNLREFVYPALRMSLANQHAANTVVGYVVFVVGLLFGLQWMGVGIGILAVFAGVIGIGVGFGLQNIANNFISGMILTFGQPIKVSDVIEVGGVVGIVREISPRSTTIETNDGKLILVPNADILTTKVINWSLGPSYIYAQLKIGVAYGSNVSLVRATMVQIAREHEQVVQVPPPFVRFEDFGSSSLDFELWAGINNPMQRFDILSDLRFEVERKFEELGIVIAFPQQDLHLNTELEEVLIHSLKTETPKAIEPFEVLDDNGKESNTNKASHVDDKKSQVESTEPSSLSSDGERWIVSESGHSSTPSTQD